MFKSLGLRKSFCIATFIQLIGAGLRYLGTIKSIIGNQNYESYVVVLIGQTLAALVQPFFTNSPSRIAAVWFSVDGRDIATALLSILGSLGIGIGNIMPTLFVQSDGTQWGGFEGLMLTELVLCAIGMLFILIFFYDQPPTAPSISQKLKLVAANQQSVGRDFRNLICNINFMCLLLGFGIGLGVFNALATLINQYTALFGYDTDNAGIFGASLIGGGLIGAFVGGGIMEKLRKYNTIIKVYTILNSIVIGCLLYALLPDNFVIVTILFGVLGFTAVPIIAVAFEAGAECSYPIDEDLSASALMTSGQIFGIVYIIVWGEFLSETPDYIDTQNNFSTYFIIGNIGLMLIFMSLYNGDYNRLDAERKIHSLVNSIDDTTTITTLPSPMQPNPNLNTKLLFNPQTE